MESRSVNLIPFREALIFHGKIDFSETIMNVIIFIPLGVYAGMLFKRWNFIQHFLFFFFTSLMVESLQYIFRIGAFDVTDIITNTSGGIIGLIIFIAIKKMLKNDFRAQKFINIIASLGTVFMLLFLFLLKTNHLRYKIPIILIITSNIYRNKKLNTIIEHRLII